MFARIGLVVSILLALPAVAMAQPRSESLAGRWVGMLADRNSEGSVPWVSELRIVRNDGHWHAWYVNQVTGVFQRVRVNPHEDRIAIDAGEAGEGELQLTDADTVEASLGSRTGRMQRVPWDAPQVLHGGVVMGDVTRQMTLELFGDSRAALWELTLDGPRYRPLIPAEQVDADGTTVAFSIPQVGESDWRLELTFDRSEPGRVTAAGILVVDDGMDDEVELDSGDQSPLHVRLIANDPIEPLAADVHWGNGPARIRVALRETPAWTSLWGVFPVDDAFIGFLRTPHDCTIITLQRPQPGTPLHVEVAFFHGWGLNVVAQAVPLPDQCAQWSEWTLAVTDGDTQPSFDLRVGRTIHGEAVATIRARAAGEASEWQPVFNPRVDDDGTIRGQTGLLPGGDRFTLRTDGEAGTAEGAVDEAHGVVIRGERARLERAGPGAAMTGRWLGTVTWDSFDLQLQLEFGAGDDGWTGTIALYEGGIPVSPIDTIHVDGRTLAFEIENGTPGADYDAIRAWAAVNDAGTLVGGAQKGQAAPQSFALRRVPVAGSQPDHRTYAGTLEVPNSPLDIEIILAPHPDGGWIATANLPVPGGRGMPMVDVEIDGDQVRMSIPSRGLPQRMDGKLGEGGETLTGTLDVPGGPKIPFNLALTDGPADTTRPQDPQPPFPYTAEDVRFDNPRASGVSLAGTLTLPEGSGPFPAVVLVSGSGPQNRDEELFNHRPFRVIADHLTRAGIAVLRYDDRGVAQSTGNFGTATSDDLASDALAAVTFLGEHERIDADRIGIVGHSEGGLIAPMVAADHPDAVAFIVLLAGPGVPGGEVIAAQIEAIGRAEGLADWLIERQVRAQHAIGDAVAAGQTGDTLRATAEAITREMWAGLTDAQREEIGVTEEVALAQARMLADQPWLLRFLVLDPRPYLERVQCPVLALNGKKDLQVLWDQNLPAIWTACTRGGNDDVTIRAFDDLNHLFQHCETGRIIEYGRIAETMAPAVLDAMCDWLLERSR